MNWKDDPEIQAEIQRRGARGSLVRTAVIWMPLFLACAAATLFYLADTARGGSHGGTWVLVIVLTVLSVLFGFQGIQAALDLRIAPNEESGFVERRWARRDSLVMQTQYMRLGRHILRGEAGLLDHISEGDYVTVSFYPHSAIIVWVAKEKPPEGLPAPTARKRR